MYDLIVIGDDLASHVAAAYAGHNGLSTLLIAESGLGGLQLIGDFVFNIDPAPLTGLGPGEAGGRLLAEMDIALPENFTSSLECAFQIILPEHRIDFYNNAESLLAELVREFPDLEGGIREYYGMAQDAAAVFQDWLAGHPQLQPQSLREYGAYLKIFPHIFRYKFGAARFDKLLSNHAALEKAWEALQALVGFNHDDLFSFASAYQYCAPLRGVSCFTQGKQFLFNALIEKLERHQGLYLSRHPITAITHGREIEVDLRTPDQAAMRMSGRRLIISTKSDKLGLLRGKHKYLNFSDRRRPAKVLYYPFTIFLGVAQKGLPQETARHIAVVPDLARDLYDDNLIILETGFPEVERRIDRAALPVTATVYLPDRADQWTPEALTKQAGAVLERLEGFLPFLKENTELADIDASVALSLEYRKVLSPRYSVRNAFFTSFAAKSHRTRFDNVFLTGTSLLTDAGFDAELISGRTAALQVIEKRT
jgi:phytoene dehydrogenase-like protein